MKIHHTLSIMALSVLFCGLPTGNAADAQPAFERKFAFIVGISDYQEFDRLPSATNDAAEILAIVNEKQYDEVVVLMNAEATGANIKSAMDRFRAKLKKNDLFGVFFAGHGIRVKNEAGKYDGYLVTHETRKAHIVEDGIPMSRMTKSINSMPNDHIILIFDACHSGEIVDGVTESAEKAGVHRNVRIVTSAKANQRAYESNEHGLFTHQLLKNRDPESNGSSAEANKTFSKVKTGMRRQTAGAQAPQFVEIQGTTLQAEEREF